VGKSTLLGSLARNAQADAVVVTTSDAPALERLRAAQTATALAEAMRDQGANVLLLVDSVTRFARAQREVGLAAGEPPARRGFPPSVFAALPRLLERAGTASVGSITAVYTVLVEGDDLDEPIADEVRGIVDGHVILDRDLASQGHYPAIDVVKSISRVMPRVVTPQQLTWSRQLRALVSAYEQKRDLIVLGGYVKGTDASVDRAIRARDQIEAYLRQGSDERTGFEDTWAKIEYLVSASYR
jgi:FliI/YscN family ATPase